MYTKIENKGSTSTAAGAKAFFQPKQPVNQLNGANGQIMRMPAGGPGENTFLKPNANLVQREDDPGKVITEGASVVKDELSNKPGFDEWKEKQTDALKKEVWDKQPAELKAGIIGFGLGSLGILGAAFANNPKFRADTIKLLDDKNIALPLSLIPYHEYFPLSSFKYKLPEASKALSFDTEFEFKPYLDLMHEKWSFVPKIDLTLGVSSEYSPKSGFDITGGSVKLKFAGGIINLQGFLNQTLPTTPMLVSGDGQSPMWIMRTLPGQFDDQLPKGSGVFLSIDIARIPEFLKRDEPKGADVQRKSADPRQDQIDAFVSKDGEEGNTNVKAVDNTETFDNGEVKQDGGVTEVKPTEIKASTGPSCDPKGVTIDEFLKQSGNTDDSFGKTTLNRADLTNPEVVLKNGVLQTTTAGMPVSSFYLLPQTFKDKGSLTIQEGGGGADQNYCPKGTYDKYWQINQSGSDKIKAGEQEHCSDFTLAFNLSLAKFRDAVNDAAGKQFGSDAIAKTYLEKQTGVHPDQWNNYFWCLASKTKERDTQKWHSPKSVRTKVDEHCQKAIMLLSAANLPDVGQHPSAEIIKDCDTKKP
ncbi:hypothetical protein [Mucilaginibacter pocheonensis]|uniref:Uncharacterized protein n=1 Tax=Mucilaginibacter pocheonensis TaxID=398050 RepID=A0ABU1TD78_9SPHI|nr:hypothetical protein [Mucilaginibacter pocheonensis]MDR6943344.1 hypothetical protein [Mucilaginibacter pocheonensis]